MNLTLHRPNDAWRSPARPLDPSPMDSFGALAVDVVNFAALTYEVPLSRLTPIVPPVYEIESFERDGQPKALVTTACFCDGRFRWAHSPFPRLTFNESTYRVYVTHKGRKGVYFVGRYLGSGVATVGQRVLGRHSWLGDFELDIRPSAQGYERYRCEIASGRGDTFFELEAVQEPVPISPFEGADEMAQHITFRPYGFFTATGGFQAVMPVVHPHMSPLQGRLRSARLGLWDELGVLDPDEAEDPHSVLLERSVPFTLYPVRPVL